MGLWAQEHGEGMLILQDFITCLNINPTLGVLFTISEWPSLRSVCPAYVQSLIGPKTSLKISVGVAELTEHFP